MNIPPSNQNNRVRRHQAEPRQQTPAPAQNQGKAKKPIVPRQELHIGEIPSANPHEPSAIAVQDRFPRTNNGRVRELPSAETKHLEQDKIPSKHRFPRPDKEVTHKVVSRFVIQPGFPSAQEFYDNYVGANTSASRSRPSAEANASASPAGQPGAQERPRIAVPSGRPVSIEESLHDQLGTRYKHHK